MNLANAHTRSRDGVVNRLGYAALCFFALIASSGIGLGIALQDAASATRIVVGIPVMVALLRYRYALLVAWAVIGPFIGSKVPFFNGSNFDTALTLPTLLLMMAIPVTKTLRRMPALAMLLAYLVWVFLGIGISPLAHDVFLKQWLLYLNYAAVGILVINVISTRQRMSRFIDVMLIAPAIIALYGIFGYFTHQNVLGGAGEATRIVSVYSSAPPLALFLSNAIPLALYRVFTAGNRGRVIASAVLVVLFCAVVLTLSRGAMIGVALDFIVAVLLLPSRRMRIGLIGGALGLTVIGSVIATAGHFPILARFAGSDTGTLNGRTLLWQALLQYFDPAQLLGNGLGAANALLTGLQIGANGQIGNGLLATSPSNLYLGTLYDNGIVGLALLLLTFLVLGLGLLARMRHAEGTQRLLVLMTLLVVVNGLIQSVDVNDLISQSAGIFFWMTVALAFARCWSRSPEWNVPVHDPRTQMESIPALSAAAAREVPSHHPTGLHIQR